MQRKHIEIKPFTWIYRAVALISRCDLDIYMMEDRNVVIAADREDNRDVGMGVEDGACIIAGVVMEKQGLKPDNTHWIEHRPDDPENIYTEVRFQFDGKTPHSPERLPIDAEAVRALVEEA